MKILVTGCNGMLGTDLIEELNKNNNFDIIGIDIKDLDLTNTEKTIDYIKNLNPDCVINCAAYTNVDGCETEIESAYKVNALVPRNIAIACNAIGSKLVHISTDYVFDGQKGTAYLEDDVVNPLSVYGKSKLAGENNVKSFCHNYFIVRTQWLYGKNGKNFVKTMVDLAKTRDELKIVNDQFGSPTYTKDLCKAILQLMQTQQYGVYHITNSDVVTWFDFTKEIVSMANIKNVKLIPCTTEEFPRPAKRPSYSPLENFNYTLNGFEKLRDFREALKEYIQEENF